GVDSRRFHTFPLHPAGAHANSQLALQAPFRSPAAFPAAPFISAQASTPMSITSLLGITPWPAVSAVLLLSLLVIALYFARRTAHQAIRAVTDALGRGLRLAAHSVARGEERLAARNREGLLSAGREAKERIIEREFVRVGDTVRKDLANYPTLHRSLSQA